MLFNLLLLIIYKKIKVTNIYYAVSGIERCMPPQIRVSVNFDHCELQFKISSPIECFFAISTLYFLGQMKSGL